jgi:nucleoid-associated protein
MEALKYAVIHELAKDRGADQAKASLRDDLLDVEKPMVVRLATLLAGLLGRDQSAVYWGQFGDRRREGPFPAAVACFAQELTGERFTALTHTAMGELVEFSAKEPLATGGFIFFAAYESRGLDYLLIAMIKERDGIALNKDYEPQEINEVDLSKLHQAAKVNLASYANEIAVAAGRVRALDEANADEDADGEAAKERTYLSFINRKGRDEIAGYFTTALGCEKGVSSARATKEVVKGVRSYVKSVEPIAQYASKARQAIIDYMDGLEDGSAVTLDVVIEVVRREIPPDQAQHINGMKAFLNADAHQIPDDFQVSKQALKAYARIVERTDHWNLNFEASALGVREGEILYDQDRHSLTITHLPPRMVRKIEQTLRDRGQLNEGG